MARESSHNEREQKELNNFGGIGGLLSTESSRETVGKQLDVSTTRTEIALPMSNRTSTIQREACDASKKEPEVKKQDIKTSNSEGNGVDLGESIIPVSHETTPNTKPSNPFSKTPSSNPFAKSSSNPFAKPSDVDPSGGGSLFQSLKRMRSDDVDSKSNLKPTKSVKGSK